MFPFFETVSGFCLGGMVIAFSNGLRRVPYMRNPWEHLIAGVVGGGLMYKAANFKVEQLKEHEALLRQFGEREQQLAQLKK